MPSAIDMYSLCPCGSGKKVKFCCRDLVQEFDRIQQMIQGGQRKACLEHVERLLKKHPQNSFLRSLQVELNYALDRFDQGDELVQQWVKQEPENPTPLGWSVISLAGQAAEEEDAQDRHKLFRMALLWLQRALEHSPDQVPAVVVRAVQLVVRLAHQQGWFLPLMGHTLFMARLEEQKSSELMYELFELMADQNTPLVARMLASLPKPATLDPDLQSEWEKFSEHLHQGRFLQAERQLEQLASQHAENELVWYHLGLVRGYLADDRGAQEAFQRAAELATTAHLRTEALALSLIVRGLFQEKFDHVGVEVPVSDADALLENLQGLPQLKPAPPLPVGLDLQRLSQNPEEFWEQSSVPPPRAVFHLVDPDISGQETDSGAGLPRWGTILLYGKETDRPARVQMLGYRWHEQDAPLGWDELVQRVPELQWNDDDLMVMSESPFYYWFAMLPEAQKNAEPKLQTQWLQTRLRQWSRLHRLPQLQGSTLAQAAQDRSTHPLIQALLLLVETLSSDNAFLDVDLDQFRRELGIGIPVQLHAANEEELARFAPCWLHRLDTRSFTPAMWNISLTQATLLFHRRAERLLAHGCYEAETWKQHPHLAFVVASALFATEPDPEIAWSKIEPLFQQVRGEETFDESSCGQWDSLLLRLHMQRGPAHLAEAVRIAQHVREAHRSDPVLMHIANQALELAYAIQAAGRQSDREPVREAHEESSGLWTPDQGSPTPAPGTQKLWTPD